MFTGFKPKGYEDVPFVEEVVAEKKYEPIISFIEALTSGLARPFVCPPGTSDDRFKTLRQSFAAAVQSSAYEELTKKAGRPAGYITPQKCESLLKKVMSMSSEQIELIKKAYSSPG